MLKTNRGRGRRSFFVIFVFWSALNVSGWGWWGFEAGWNRNFFLVLFMNEGSGVSPRFYTFVSGVTREWNGEVSSRFPSVIPRVERFSLDLLQAVKKYRECALELGFGGWGLWLDHSCMKIVTTGWYKGKFSELITWGLSQKSFCVNNCENCVN